MAKAMPAFICLTGLGAVVYFTAQYVVPSSLRAKMEAEQTISKIRLEPQAQAAPSPVESPIGDETKPMPIGQDKLVIQRNAYLDSAIQSLAEEQNKLVCARAEFYRQLATQKQTELGVQPEEFLLDMVTQQNGEMLRITTERGGFNGNADSQTTGRPLILDQLAILKALQDMANGQAPGCLAEPYQAGEFTTQYITRARQYRAKLKEEAQANEQSAKQ